MGHTENVRDITIAFTSTSALLLTILAIGHLPVLTIFGWFGLFVVSMAVFGLYGSIASGAYVMLALARVARNPLKARYVNGAIVLMIYAFGAGLAGVTCVVVLSLRIG